MEMLLLLLPLVVEAVPCFLLQNSKQCPNQNNLQIQATSVYGDSAGFDTFVQSRLDTNPPYAQEFIKSFACPGYTGQGQRFHLSIYCSLLTAKPSNCDSTVEETSPRIPLCKETCLSAQSSLQSLFNSQTCTNSPSTEVSALRQSTLKAYGDHCATLSINNTSQDKCLDGSTQPQEQSYCGKSN